MCNTRLPTSSSPQLVSIKLRSIWKANKNGHAEFQNFVRLLGATPWGRQSSHYLVITWISTKRVRLESAQTCRRLCRAAPTAQGIPGPCTRAEGHPSRGPGPPSQPAPSKNARTLQQAILRSQTAQNWQPGAAQKSKDRAPPMKAITGGCLILEPQAASPSPCPRPH